MRKAFTLLIVILSITLNAQDTLRVLAIGNSFSADALEHYFRPVCRAGGVEVVAVNLYIPSCTLRNHLKNMRSDEPVYSLRRVEEDTVVVTEKVPLSVAMAAERWDYISVQQASHYSGVWSTYTPYLGPLLDSIRSRCPDAKICWHQTWAYPKRCRLKAFARYHYSQQEMYDSIQACSRRVMNSYAIDRLIPVGEAIQRVREEGMESVLHRDQLHLSRSYGQWLAAEVWYRALTERPFEGDTGEWLPEEIDVDTARRMVRCLAPAEGVEEGK